MRTLINIKKIYLNGHEIYCDCFCQNCKTKTPFNLYFHLIEGSISLTQKSIEKLIVKEPYYFAARCEKCGKSPDIVELPGPLELVAQRYSNEESNS